MISDNVQWALRGAQPHSWLVITSERIFVNEEVTFSMPRKHWSSAHPLLLRLPTCKFEMPKGISKKRAQRNSASQVAAKKKAAEKRPNASPGARALPPPPHSPSSSHPRPRLSPFPLTHVIGAESEGDEPSAMNLDSAPEGELSPSFPLSILTSLALSLPDLSPCPVHPSRLTHVR